MDPAAYQQQQYELQLQQQQQQQQQYDHQHQQTQFMPLAEGYVAALDQRTLPSILCCMCGCAIEANAANMCVRCIRSQVDITEGIPKQLTIHSCRSCGRYLQPPNYWADAALESRELLSLCLKKIKGLNKVKLVDASWVWTEPHSRRLKVKLTIQKEVFTSTILQQQFVVEFVVANQQCDKCQQFNADNTWWAVAQVRQKVPHKRTFLWLEQVILRHDAHSQCSNIKDQPDGLDFFFANKNQMVKFVDFIGAIVPVRYKTAKQLISQDLQNNIFNFKFTTSVEIAPICRDDLVCLPRRLAASLGNICPLVLCAKVSGIIHFVDPLTLQYAELNANRYWRDPFRPISCRPQLVSFIVLDVNLVGRTLGRFMLADVQVARESDLGYNDTQFLTRTHLGHLLKPGDTVMGYDLLNANWNDTDLESMRGRDLPDLILVRKAYPHRRSKSRRRRWKLRGLNKEVDESSRRTDIEAAERDQELFLQDLEEDPELRSQVNLYRDADYLTASESDVEDEGFPEVRVDELLDDFDNMTLEG